MHFNRDTSRAQCRPYSYFLILYRTTLRKKRFWIIFVAVLAFCWLMFLSMHHGNHKKLNTVETSADRINVNFQLKIYKNMLNDSNVDLSNASFEIDIFNEYKKSYKTKLDEQNKDYKSINYNSRAFESIKKPFYKVLEYTHVFSQTKYCQLFDNKSESEQEQVLNKLYLSQCKYKNCRFTCDKRYAQHVDAILFHETDLNNELYRDSHYLDPIVRNRNPNQIWILWNDEANYVYKSLDKYKFNWTLSYRHDAEISDCAYGCKYHMAERQQKNDFKEFKDSIRSEFYIRENGALWFVSNCDSIYRTDFAIKLNKFYPVSFVGLCAKAIDLIIKYSFLPVTNIFVEAFYYVFTFLQEKIYGKKHSCGAFSECEVSYVFSNKFYLSFESKNCSHYITEKFWRLLRTGLIPVVIQPNKQFYESIAPKDSYIHAQDFNNDPKMLANYLKNVSDNFDLYLKYFMWKRDYDVVYSGRQAESRRICELCTKLNTESSSIYYESVSKWFNSDCILN